MLLQKAGQLVRLNRLIGFKSVQMLVQPRFFVSSRDSILYATAGSKNESRPVAVKEKEIQLDQKIPTVSFMQRLKAIIGIGFKYRQVELKFAATKAFLSIQYQVDYDKFYKKLDAPDTMYSYCLVTFFHVWLVK
jgi:hypothetical protein